MGNSYQFTGTTLGAGIGHVCYEVFYGTKTPDSEGWTYGECEKCHRSWRSKTVTEYLDTPPAKQGDAEGGEK
jgi:hypothetical protein